MELNWIKVAIAVITLLIFYAIYKMINIIKDINGLKQSIKLIDQPPQTKQQHQEHSLVEHMPVHPVRPTPVQQPPPSHNLQPIQIKLQPPTLLANKKIDKEDFVMVDSEHESERFAESEADDEADTCDEFECEDEPENMDAFTKDMIIPLDLNSILEQVIADKMASKKPHTEIQEIDAESSEQTPVDDPVNKTNDLKSKTITELKEIAKSKNIKLTENGKPKNKETLIKEISNL